MKRIVYWLVLVIFPMLGGLLIYSAVTTWLTARQSVSWPTADGEILSVEVVEQDPEYSLRKRGEAEKTNYHADIRYRYQVDGRDYEGNRITANDSASIQREDIEAITSGYSAGQSIPVYYNPDSPDQALLQPGKSGDSVVVLIMGLAFLILPPVMIVLYAGSDLFPNWLRLWWNIKFGKWKDLKDDDGGAG